MQVVKMDGLYITRPNSNRDFRQPFGVIHRSYSPISGVLEMERDPSKLIQYKIQVRSNRKYMVLGMASRMAADPLTRGLLEDIIPVAQGIASANGWELEIPCGMAHAELKGMLRRVRSPGRVFRIRTDGRPVEALLLPENGAVRVLTTQA